MSGEAGTVTRRWSGYVCPSCRFVFKVPVQHDGRGVVCPGCRRLLRLPAAGEVGDPLVVAVEEEESGPEAGELRRRRSRSRRSGGEAESKRRGLSWERSGRRSGADRSMVRGLWWIGGATVTLVLVVFLLMRWFGGGRTLSSGAVAAGDVSLPSVPGIGESAWLPAGSRASAAGGEGELTQEERGDQLVSAALETNPGLTLAATEKVARQFLEAGSVDEMLASVRRPERAGERMREWYSKQPWKRERMRSFGKEGKMIPLGSMVAVVVELGDFTKREMAFERIEGGYRVDWESWVGWSELPWSEFIERRPVEGKEFRVSAKPGTYYNFGFVDEDAWSCYVLLSPDNEGEKVLYGYAAKGSKEDLELVAGCAGERASWVLELAFPADAKASNQVIIRKVLAKGWIFDGEGGGK